MSPTLRASLFPLGVAATLAVPLVLLSERVANAMGADRPYEVRYVPEGRALAFLPPAIKLSIANVYWLAAIQYIGDKRGSQLADPEALAQLYPLIDLVTDLDPPHGYAYQTAGIILSTAGRLDESDRILKKGIERGPNWWSYPFYIAFNDYFYRGDYPSAARWARQAARTPGASANISQLALALEVKSGDPESGLALVRELLASAPDGPLRERLEEQEKLAQLQVDFRLLDGLVARYAARHGRPPARLEALVEDGLLAAVPPEPFGGRYRMEADGKVHSTGRDFRFRPPDPARTNKRPPAAPWRADEEPAK